MVRWTLLGHLLLGRFLDFRLGRGKLIPRGGEIDRAPYGNWQERNA
jgi:hypothetical protein